MPKNGLEDMLWTTDLSLVRPSTTKQNNVIPTFPRLLITLPAPTARIQHLCPQFCYKTNKKFCKSKTEWIFSIYYGGKRKGTVGFIRLLILRNKLDKYLFLRIKCCIVYKRTSFCEKDRRDNEMCYIYTTHKLEVKC